MERFSASNAAKHMACHASADLESAIPNYVPPERDDTAGAKGVGTNRHKLFADFNELTAGEMRKMLTVFEYMADLRATRRFKVLIETKMTAAWLDQPTDTTADVVLYTQDELHIIDYKNGKIPVEVIDNEQLLFYAVTYAHLAPKAKGATLHILQPYADGNQSWFADTTRIKEFMDEAIEAQRAILAGDLTFGPSDHCTFCPANPHSRGDKGRPLCPVMMKMLYPPIIDESEILGL